MNTFNHLIEILQWRMQEPTPYGWFHWLSIAVVAAVTILLCVKFRDCKEKTFRRILLIGWVLIVVLEIYKQVVFVSIHGAPGNYYWEYHWGGFPYQFCSTPLYVLPFIIFCKPGKLRDACMAFMSTFVLLAGIAVYLFPETVLSVHIGHSIQTMVHHGLQLVFGIYIAVYNRRRFNVKWYLTALPVFGVLVLVAVLLDSFVPMWIGSGYTFNMFFISWRYPGDIPFITVLHWGFEFLAKIPYPVFLFLYLLAFSLVAFAVFGALFGAFKLAEHLAEKKKKA